MGTQEFEISRELIPQVLTGAEQVVNVCMQVKQGENVVIVQDEKSAPVAKFLIDQVKIARANLKIVNIGDFGSRPLTRDTGKTVVSQVSGADAAFVCSNYIQEEFLHFLKPVTDLTDNERLRLAMMFDLDKDIRLMTWGMNADYQKIKELNDRLFPILQKGKEMRVTSEAGTDFVAKLGYKWVSYDGFPKPGKWVNLPDGEILSSPKDMNGRLVVNGVVEEFDNPKFGVLSNNPIEMDVVDGRIVVASVKSKNAELEKNVKASLVLDENANRIGELACGTNISLKELIGNLSLDEKFPSIHVAWGDPYGAKTGADWTSIQHRDAVMVGTTVYVDDVKIMDNGRYIV